jgi:hypothetical protein
MRLGTLLGVAAIYLALAGLGFIFAPLAFGAGAVPADPSPALIHYLRLFGSPFLGIAVLDWRVRNAAPSPVRDAVVLGNVVGFGTIAALDIYGLFSGAREVTKLFAAVHVIFALAFLWAGRAGRR